MLINQLVFRHQSVNSERFKTSPSLDFKVEFELQYSYKKRKIIHYLIKWWLFWLAARRIKQIKDKPWIHITKDVLIQRRVGLLKKNKIGKMHCSFIFTILHVYVHYMYIFYKFYFLGAFHFNSNPIPSQLLSHLKYNSK